MQTYKPILLIDDDTVDAMSVKRAYKKLELPNVIHHVREGQEALNYLSNPDNILPELILLDLNMPDIHGTELLDKLKKNIDFKHIPVVVLTTSDEKKDRVQTFRRGAAGYLVKPVKFGAFVNMVETLNAYWSINEQYY